MNVTFFSTQDDFRKWLEKNHQTETELLVGFYKVNSQKPSMTWSQSVDQALCFGWIDGIRKSIDEQSYCIRFTPRRKTSIWSEVNIKKVEELTRKNLMTPEGLKAFSYRKEDKSGVYSYENELTDFKATFENEFKKNKLALDFFEAQAPSYKRAVKHWVMAAKQEKTRLTRLEKLIRESGERRRIY